MFRAFLAQADQAVQVLLTMDKERPKHVEMF
jgi:hypothetical protein